MVAENGDSFFAESAVGAVISPLANVAEESLKDRVFPTREYLDLVEKVGDGEFMNGYVGIMKEVALQLELASLVVSEPQKIGELYKLYNKLNHQGPFGYIEEVLLWVNNENRGDIVNHLRAVYDRKFFGLSDQKEDSMKEYYTRAKEAVHIVLNNYPR